jgi:PAS domain S-box-containing protein
MSIVEPDDLIRSLEELPVAAILTELRTRTLVALNDRAATLFGAPAADLVGTDVLSLIDPRDRDAASTAYAALAGKVIDGYQVQRRIVTPEGEERTLHVCGRRVEAPDTLYGLWVLLPGSDPTAAIETLMMGASCVVLAVTDHDWQIEYMSADAELLGARGSELRGFPLLGLVHPSAATAFLAAAGRATTDHLAVTVLTRMRAGDRIWADRYCLMVPICEHHPPRLGLVISPIASTDTQARVALDEKVRHAAIEARAARTLDTLPALAHLAPGNELSARQSEIVARLMAGERQADIARSMFLSPSTVRNHLTAIYTKFGVHSQAQLLALLLRTAASDDH